MIERELTVRVPHGKAVLIVDDEIASHYRVWHAPVEIMVEPGRDGNHEILEATLRPYVCPEQHV